MSEYLSLYLAHNDIYILWCYLASAVVLIGLALFSWRAKKQDERTLGKLEKQIRDSSNNRVE